MKDSSIILNRLRKNLKNRKNLVKNSKLTAYRLYEKDIPEYPYIIDIYNDHAVVYEKGKKIDEEDDDSLLLQREHQKHIEEALGEILSIPMLKVIFKKRQKQKGKSQYNQICKKDEFFPVNENGMKFLVNLFDYLDTGLYLDHRPLRKIIKDSSLSKRVLNLFSYTGSLSVAAAMGGGKVTTIDMSKTYMDWAVQNFWENSIDPEMHEFIQTDVIQYLEAPLKVKYDIIILDPPSFSNSKRMQDVFDIQEDHGWMIRNLMKSLTKNGVLYFSNNFRKFKLDDDIVSNFEIKDITKKSIPMDFRDLKIHVCFELRNK
jgi:23S rRNA (cytosine1962-C5)-methyltransferase/23S rRNA (guanine2445-N2)-methyltransferase / 23S rRNA (guanine2069-N7)-methyltransferase